MEKFVHLASSSNPIELDQMMMTLEQSGIPNESRGKKSLEIGSVDFTGMSGAGLYVPQDKLLEAKKILVKTGLLHENDLPNNQKKDNFMRNGIILLGLVLVILLALGVIGAF